MSFYNKYRPSDFDQIVGNSATVSSLKLLVEKPDPPHAYLFHGPKGCGKTTLARIVAKAMGCDPEYGVVEINCAQDRGIDMSRDINKHAAYMPFRGKAIAYLLDEVHMTNKFFQNDLLKILEETPKHVYFMLCTTEPDGLIPTVRDRCFAFRVESLRPQLVMRVLDYVCKAECVNIPHDLLVAIAANCDGSCRKALVGLEQVMGMSDVDIDTVLCSMETESRSIGELCQALIKRKAWNVVRGILSKVQDDPEKVRLGILGYSRKVLLNGDHTEAVSQAHISIRCLERPLMGGGAQALLAAACYEIANNP